MIMNKLIGLAAAGCFAAGTLFAGEQGEGMMKVQNETKQLRMACSIPTYNLKLTDAQRQKMAAVLAEHHKTGCTEASEAKFVDEAKKIMTPEQYAKFKEEYDRSPKMKM
jgi:Spy/CpxP family protein refolding chaperone